LLSLRVVNKGDAVGSDGLVVTSPDGTVAGAAGEALLLTQADLTNSELRSERIGQCASIISADLSVRQALLEYQRTFCTSPPDGSRGAVLDGRDIGTVIYPEAPVKLFITADPAIRAHRRHLELLNAGRETTLDQVKHDMRQRDIRDSTRAGAPLRPAEDAIALDTSSLAIDEVYNLALQKIRLKLPHLFE